MLEAGTGKRRFLPPHHPDHPLQVALADARAELSAAGVGGQT
jgi:hypothetical protein